MMITRDGSHYSNIIPYRTDGIEQYKLPPRLYRFGLRRIACSIRKSMRSSTSMLYGVSFNAEVVEEVWYAIGKKTGSYSNTLLTEFHVNFPLRSGNLL